MIRSTCFFISCFLHRSCFSFLRPLKPPLVRGLGLWCRCLRGCKHLACRSCVHPLWSLKRPLFDRFVVCLLASSLGRALLARTSSFGASDCPRQMASALWTQVDWLQSVIASWSILRTRAVVALVRPSGVLGGIQKHSLRAFG